MTDTQSKPEPRIDVESAVEALDPSASSIKVVKTATVAPAERERRDVGH
jgi:hypothetical protein